MNIYVSNINFTTLDESLFNLFATYGEVASAKIITDRETGRSRGFGFVEMNDETTVRRPSTLSTELNLREKHST